MANTLSAITRITGSTGTAESTSPTFSGGTQLDKMFHFASFRMSVSANLNDQTYRDTELTNTSTLLIRAGQTGGGNQDITYMAFIVSYTIGDDIVTQRQTSTNTAASVTLTFSPTLSATSRSFLIPHGETNTSDTTIGQEEIYRYQITNTTTGTYEVDDATEGLRGFKFEVVDWGNDDITVQHLNAGTMGTGATSSTQTIGTAVTLAKTWTIFTYRTEAGAFSEPATTFCARGDLQNTTTVRLRRNSTGEQLNWTCQVIEDTAGTVWDVDQGNISLANTTASGDFTITAVDAARTFPCGTSFSKFAYEGQSSDTTTGDPDKALCTVDLVGTTIVRAERGATNGTLDIFVQAIELLAPAAAGPPDLIVAPYIPT